MVSSVLGMAASELVTALERLGRAYADDEEYREARAKLPAEWPF